MKVSESSGSLRITCNAASLRDGSRRTRGGKGGEWRCVIIHLSGSRAAFVLNEAGDTRGERTHGRHVRASTVISHYSHDSETRAANKFHFKKKRKNPVLYIFKCCRRLSCKLQEYWSLCDFFLSVDLILALPLTSRATRATSTRQHVGSNLSDQKGTVSESTFPRHEDTF